MGLANRISLCHKYYMYAGAKHENASRCVKSRMKKVNWNRYSKVKVFQNSQMFGNSVGDSFFACLLLWRARCAWCRPTHVSGHEPPQKCPCFASLAIRIALTCVQTYIYKHIHVHTCVVTYIHIQMSLQIYGGIYIYTWEWKVTVWVICHGVLSVMVYGPCQRHVLLCTFTPTEGGSTFTHVCTDAFYNA